LQVVKNTFGKFIYLQETKKDAQTRMMKIVGGAMVDIDCIPELIQVLRELHSLEGDEGLRLK
jgi:hypothetical protein